MFWFGRLFYVILLLINSIAVLSEDRFLARIGWSSVTVDNGFGVPDSMSIKNRMINLISAVRTLMRSMLSISCKKLGAGEMVVGTNWY